MNESKAYFQRKNSSIKKINPQTYENLSPQKKPTNNNNNKTHQNFSYNNIHNSNNSNATNPNINNNTS